MIVASAIRSGSIIFTGKRHGEIISEMVKNGFPTPIKGEQGFIDENGKFYNRKEAGIEAIKCKQIEKLRWPGMGLDSVEVFPRNKG